MSTSDPITIDPATIQERIAGRKWAEEILSDLSPDESDPFRRAFMDRMKQCFTAAQLDPTAMSDKQAIEFGTQVLGFGQHSAKSYDECPLDYLEWLADQSAALQRYLRSRRIQRERKDDD